MDWFKDLVLELRYGLDPEKMREERIKKREAEKTGGLIFRKRTRRWLVGLGIFFFVYIFYSVYFTAKGTFESDNKILSIAGFCSAGVLDLAAIVFLFMKKKNAQIIGVCIIGLFAVMVFLFPAIFGARRF